MANQITVMWLDRENSDDRRVAIEELRKITGQLELFSDASKCEAALQRSTTQVILVVSGQMGQQLVPRVHHLRQLAVVFVYCMDKKRNKEWSQRYAKVRKIFTDLNKLIRYVQEEVQHLLALTLNTQESTKQHRSDVSSSGRPYKNDYSFPKSHTGTATNVSHLTSIRLGNRWQQDADLGFDQLKIQQHELSSLNFRSNPTNKSMMELRVFIEFIIRLPQSNNPEERKPLCDSLKHQYSADVSTYSKITEFENEYQPSKAIFWYTSETCFYKELNSALRQFNYSRLVDFAFFIRDIHHQLSSEKKERPPSSNGYRHVFRGQLMSKMELHLLESLSTGHASPMASLIPFMFETAQMVPQKEALVMKTFLSTSKNRNLAEMYLSDRQRPNDETQAVLIRIDIGDDPAMPCASVAHLSQFGFAEDEVIFMIGSVFWLHSVSRNNHIWIVDLKARQVYDQMNNASTLSSTLSALFKSTVENQNLEQMLAYLFNEELSTFMNTEEAFARVQTKLPSMDKGTWIDVASFLFIVKQYKVAEKTFRRALNIAIETDKDEDRRQCYEYLAKLAEMRGDTEEYKQFMKHQNMLNSKSTSHAQGLPFDEFAYLRNDNQTNSYLDQLSNIHNAYNNLMSSSDLGPFSSSNSRGFGSR